MEALTQLNDLCSELITYNKIVKDHQNEETNTRTTTIKERGTGNEFTVIRQHGDCICIMQGSPANEQETPKEEPKGVTPQHFTRVNNDVNGNPRYVIHFLHLCKDSDNEPITQRYAVAVKRARKLGGRKYHNKQYGGGIVFQSYSIPDLCREINDLMSK